MFKLTGNNVVDLLQIIQYFHKLQITLIIIFCYNLFILFINKNITCKNS